jgi:superfamily II DNA or RNA helicase
MDKAYNAAHRHGFTGTLADSKTNEMCLEGMFGKIHQVVTTSELMEQGHVAQLKIKGLILKYPDHVRKKMKRVKYPDEVKFLVTCEARNRFIKNLVLSLPQNTMVMFHHIEHGKYMFEQVKKETNRPVYYIAGGTDTEERERVRKILEVEDNAIIFGSRGTMSTGSNTKSLHNIIFASPTKSKIQTLQSIGRGLRKTELKTKVTLFDIADDLHCPGWTNYVLSHFKERVKIYLSESFDFKLYEIDLVVKQE